MKQNETSGDKASSPVFSANTLNTDTDPGKKEAEADALHAALYAELERQTAIINSFKENQQHLIRQYNHLIELTDSSFLTIDRAGNITDCNKMAAKILGRQSSSLTGISFTSLLEKTEIFNFNTWLDKVWNINSGLHLPVKLHEYNGKSLLIEIKAFTSTETNAVRLYIALQNTEYQLRKKESEEKYKTLIEQAYDGVIIYDLTGTILEFNDKAHHYLGYTKEEFEKLSLLDLFFAEDMVLNPITFNTLKAGRPIIDHRKLKMKDGTGIEMELNSKMMPDGTVMVFGRDITLRIREAEEMQRLSKIIQNSRDEVFIINPDTMLFEYANDAALKSLGYTAPEFYQLGPEDIKPLLPELDFSEKIASLVTGKAGKVNFESVHLRKDTSAYPVEIYAQLIDIGDKEVLLWNARDISEKKKAAIDLERKEKYFRTLIEYSSSAIILFDEEGNFIYQSPVVEKIVGYSVEEGIQSNLLSFIHPDDEAQFKEKLRIILQHPGTTEKGQYRFKHQDGHYIWLEGAVTNLLNIEYIHALIGNYQDISERKAAEERMKTERVLLRTLIDNLPDAIYVKDIAGRKIIANKADQVFMGLAGEEIVIGKTDIELFPGPVGKTWHNTDMQIMQRNEPVYNMDQHCYNSTGIAQWVLMSKIPLHNAAGLVTGLLGIGRDITLRKQIEDELVKSNERYQYVTRATFDAVWDWDIENRELFWGENFEKYFGYPTTESKKNLSVWNRNIHPDDFERVSKTIEKVIEGPENIWADEYRFKRANGEYAYVQDKGMTIRNKAGRSVRMIGAMHDVTEQKKDEEKVKRLNGELAVKAHALSNSNSELEKFAYVASHDLQEPLRMISSFLQLLQKKYQAELDETAGRYIDFAVDGANRMKNLINDLLEYSRVSIARDIVGDTDMNLVIKEVKEIFMISIEESGAIIQSGNLPVLPGTRKILMLQLMQNLVGNALKYHGTEKPVIVIEASDEGKEWLFSVTDNGIGIDPAFADKIFIIFQRLHNREEFSGNGIGLSICKKIVEIHDGRIWVMPNSNGSGSVFNFTISKAI